MKIIILNYNTGNIDIYTIPEENNTDYEDIEDWFFRTHDYNLSEIHWMICENVNINIK